MSSKWLAKEELQDSVALVSVNEHHRPIVSHHHHLHQARSGGETEKRASTVNLRGKNEWPPDRRDRPKLWNDFPYILYLYDLLSKDEIEDRYFRCSSSVFSDFFNSWVFAYVIGSRAT